MAKRQTTDPWAIGGRLTDSIAAALTPPASGNRIRWDGPGGLAGFGCRVTSAGAKAWVIRYRNADGRDRTATIGTADPEVWSCAKARARAGELRQSIDLGADPLSDRKAQREAEDVAGLLKLYLAAHGPQIAPATRKDYASIVRDHITPAIGAIKLTALRRTDCQQLHDAVVATGATVRANRALAVLSGALSFAIERELLVVNPARGVRLTREQPRQQFMTPVEIERLHVALNGSNEQGADAIRLLLYSGARKSEVLGMAWAELDLTAGAWVKPATRTKARREHRIPLSAPAVDVLKRLRNAADIEDERRAVSGLPPVQFVFPSSRTGQAQGSVRKLWETLCRDAKIEGVRLHDVRHSYASVLAAAGMSLPIIGALLGHTVPATTQRYVGLLDATLRAATEAAGKIIGK